ncbi:UNVERIFIED_CONTAM: hypothetical protein RF648_21570 [Kocuria sp. CPCC 205274]
MSERVLAAIVGSPTPKEELEGSMEVLERETLRIRREQEKKILKPSYQELVARNNAKGKTVRKTQVTIPTQTVLKTQVTIPTQTVLKTVYVRKVVKEATIDRPAEYALVAVKARVATPVREFIGLGPWGW